MKTFTDYEAAALSTAIYPGQGTPNGLIYAALKAAGEAGEFAGHYLNRALDTEAREQAMLKEIGDELWYLAAKARELGTTLAEVLVFDDIDAFEGYAMRGQASSLPLGALALRGCEIAGQFAEQLGKALRDDNLTHCQFLTADRREKLTVYLLEHGQNLGQKADALGYKLSDIAQRNVDKLLDRKARGVLGGSGDNR